MDLNINSLFNFYRLVLTSNSFLTSEVALLPKQEKKTSEVAFFFFFEASELLFGNWIT